MYLLKYNNGLMLDTLVKLYRLCDSEIPLYPTTDINDKESTGTVIRETLLVTLKVLINLTHHFNKSCKCRSYFFDIILVAFITSGASRDFVCLNQSDTTDNSNKNLYINSNVCILSSRR